MAEGFADTASNLLSGTGGTATVLIWGAIVGGILLFIIIAMAFFIWNKKRWNLRVEIKLSRSNNNIINAEWGKGFFNAKRGVVTVKRKGVRGKINMPIFDIRRYLQGTDILTVIQVGPEDYRPVLNKSWLYNDVEYEETDDKTGKPTGKTKIIKESLLNVEVDTGLNKPWKTAFEAAAKKAYSLTSFMQQFQTPIAIGIVIICCCVGFTLLLIRLGSVCGG